MSLKHTLSYVAVIAVAASSALSTQAASLYLTSVSPSATQTVTFPGMSAETTPYVGQINWTFDRNLAANAALAALLPGNTLSTFCIEGTQNVYLSQTANFANVYSDITQAPQDNVGSLYSMGSAKATALNKFWDVYYGQATLSNANGAAFQLGIWEILYDSSPNFSAGSFKASSTADATSILALSTAQTWLANYNSISPTTHFQLYALSDPGLQDQLFGIPTFGQQEAPPSTPLPAALPAGMALLGALAVGKTLRRKHA